VAVLETFVQRFHCASPGCARPTHLSSLLFSFYDSNLILNEFPDLVPLPINKKIASPSNGVGG